MKPYEILGHTADLRLRVQGKTKNDLFRHALHGMAEVMRKEEHGDGKHPPLAIHRDIVVVAPDETALLVDFLNEVLYFSNINFEVYRDIKIFTLTGTKLEGELRGEQVARFDEDIKAATYHEAEITKNPAGYYEVTLVFDI